VGPKPVDTIAALIKTESARIDQLDITAESA
jgi:hypothetical protein